MSPRKGGARNEMIWDERCPHLALSIRTTGYKSWNVVYRHGGKPRWLNIGDARYIGLADTRRLTARVMLDVAEGKYPVAERKAERGADTFAELASHYSSCGQRSTTSRGGRPRPWWRATSCRAGAS